MSLSSPDSFSLAALGSSGVSGLSPASFPASIRKDGTKAQAAYAEGLEFEQVLVGQLTRQLSETVSGDAGSQGSEYSTLIQQTLTQSIMSGGGIGIAAEIANSLDPAIDAERS